MAWPRFPGWEELANLMARDDRSQGDAALMMDLQQRQKEALSRLIARWQEPLLAFAYRYTQDQADSAEVVRETFVRVYQNRHSYRAKNQFSVWAFAIAVDLCRGPSRGCRREPTARFDLPPPKRDRSIESDWMENNQAPGGREISKAVSEAVGALPNDLRTTLLLFQSNQSSLLAITVVFLRQ